tara:strand:- start:171 stop:1442 length:1272 start_codon:yes stop_codon:yes gene_type:complete
MKLHQILKNLQNLHPKEIDLSLSRIVKLCNKLGNPQKNLKFISVVGTNGKYSTIQAMRAILKEEKIKCNIYTSPHIQKINERYIFNDIEISDKNLEKLLVEVKEINNNDPITYFEILTAAFFYNARNFKNNINIVEAGLFHRFDATNIIKSNIASIITPIGLDHLDWLPKNEQNINKIIFEKTSSLLNSKIIISKQSSSEISKTIERTIKDNNSKKIFFSRDYNYSLKENGFFYYEDKFGGIKLPAPNLHGEFQLSNIATAIATVREVINKNIKTENIKKGITKIKSIARLQEIKKGKIKQLVKNNKILVDGSHNPLGASVLADYLNKIPGRKHIILGMMKNKDHLNYINFLKDKVFSITTIDIPNQPNSIKGLDLQKKLIHFDNVKSRKSIKEAIVSLDLKDNDVILITGSLYLAGEVLNQN